MCASQKGRRRRRAEKTVVWGRVFLESPFTSLHPLTAFRAFQRCFEEQTLKGAEKNFGLSKNTLLDNRFIRTTPSQPQPFGVP